MRFDNTMTFGWENAVIGMRLPMSFDFFDAQSKTDSAWNHHIEKFELGKKDLELMQKLIKADNNGENGQPNSKFLRMIGVSVAITAPLCFFKELDTYKVPTVSNSTSTMHKIALREITDSCFEANPLTGSISKLIDIGKLEECRQEFNETHDKALWYDLIYGLGDSWLQTRMWQANYATLRNIYYWRKNHKQNCWSGKDNSANISFKAWIESLPYAKELICSE